MITVILPTVEEVLKALKEEYRFERLEGCWIKSVDIKPKNIHMTGFIIWHWTQKDFGNPEAKVSMVEFDVYDTGSCFDETVVDIGCAFDMISVEDAKQRMGEFVERLDD